MIVSEAFGRIVGRVDSCPWGTVAGRAIRSAEEAAPPRTLYTAEQRIRRDATAWTTVQAILAPLQFAVFLLSLGFVIRTLLTGDGATAANASVVIKTLTLYAIMVTGAIWEKKVFGRYLFAPAFWWEDAFSMVVIALHTAYLWALATHSLDQNGLLLLALCAYAAYAINATQFILKLRAARMEQNRLAAWRVAPAQAGRGASFTSNHTAAGAR